MFNTKVYVILQELPLKLHNELIVKIGVSNDVEGRLRSLQTGSAYKLHLIESFDAGVEALKHESYIHELYDEYRKMGEWFTFDRHFFTQKVLPQMVDYFSNIEIIEGKVASTNLQLEELKTDIINLLHLCYQLKK